MAKRFGPRGTDKKRSHSHKTKKRLEIKHRMLAERAAKKSK